ncbi:hypothetical protein PVMG_03660 [Plasmodium vivax Mauritania I]|uniref:Uncharacterized protein n=1 Tax=Plasmodium vivax Mauritania I TaxID=1035515 RepID=A0A0J9T9W5_PLAVI|nr:hypothetical protein PVMG_03660 [Plasmodium vivax Mauritania I]
MITNKSGNSKNNTSLKYLTFSCICLFSQKNAVSFRGELNSERFYDSLNGIQKFSEYIEHCNSLDSLHRGSQVKKKCAKLLKYLKTDYANSNTAGASYNVCILLNYWIYDELAKIYYFDNKSYIGLAFEKLTSIWNSFIKNKLDKNKDNICSPISSIVNNENWKQIKELYDYYVDFDYLKKMADISENCKEYYIYIKSKSHIYKYFKDRCPPSEKNKCTEFHNIFIKYDPDTVLPSLLCHGKMEVEKAAARKNGDEGEKEEFTVTGRPSGFQGRDHHSGVLPFLSDRSKSTNTIGNVLLCVVVTSMASGAIYKVNVNSLINIYL